MKKTKKFCMLLLCTLCLQLLVGCGNKTAKNETGDMANNATSKPVVTASPEVPDSTAQDYIDNEEMRDTTSGGNDGVINDMGDAVSDMVDDAGDTVKDVADGAGDVVKDATDGVSDTVDNVTNNK